MHEDLTKALLDRSGAISRLQSDLLRDGPGAGARDVSAFTAALHYDEPGLLSDYVTATGVAMLTRGAQDAAIQRRFEALRLALERTVPEAAPAMEGCFASAAEAARRAPAAREALFSAPSLDADASEFLETLLTGRIGAAGSLLRKRALAGKPIERLYVDIVRPAMYDVGRRWELNEIDVAQEHAFTAGVMRLLAELEHLLQGYVTRNKFLVACPAYGESHELGIRMICDFYRMRNWYVHYAGTGVSPKDLVDFVVDSRADVLALSVTTLENLIVAGRTIAAVRRRSGRATKIVVGGRPFDLAPELWSKLDADAAAADGETAAAFGEALPTTNTGRAKATQKGTGCEVSPCPTRSGCSTN